MFLLILGGTGMTDTGCVVGEGRFGKISSQRSDGEYGIGAVTRKGFHMLRKVPFSFEKIQACSFK